METLFEELKRYVAWSESDESALRALYPMAAPEFERIAGVFYQRILDHDVARKVLERGESSVGQLKVSLQAWMHTLLRGPWDEAYYQRRARIGRVHVRIALPQHYMLGAMNVIRGELKELVTRQLGGRTDADPTRLAIGKILDLELAIMLHTYREDLEAQQARSERLATFGQLVGSIGHELRNPLGVIESSLYILKGRVGGDERSLKHVARIGEQLALANQIISDLLDMIRDRPLGIERFRLAPLVQAVIASTKHPPEVRISANLDQLPEILADGPKLRQVFVNLLDNAVHAVGDAGEISIGGEVQDGQLVLSVEDSGPGVDASIRSRLFEPLITTKAKGIGLGLPLVRRIVERHGGKVTYEPRRDKGARFVVRLPLVGESHG